MTTNSPWGRVVTLSSTSRTLLAQGLMHHRHGRLTSADSAYCRGDVAHHRLHRGGSGAAACAVVAVLGAGPPSGDRLLDRPRRTGRDRAVQGHPLVTVSYLIAGAVRRVPG